MHTIFDCLHIGRYLKRRSRDLLYNLLRDKKTIGHNFPPFIKANLKFEALLLKTKTFLLKK